jgi:hypothetical protein
MISNQKELVGFINGLLSPDGFIKKGNVWYYETAECVVLFGIEKSKWGGQFGTVVTTLVKQLEDTKFPKPHQCHIHGLGLEHLVKNRSEFEKSLDLEFCFSNNEREDVISAAIVDVAIPFLKKVSTISGIIASLQEAENLRHYMILKLKNHLGI